MPTTVDFQAVTDRVLGLRHPIIRALPRQPRRLDRLLALLLLLVSAAATLGSLALWATGHGIWALRLFGGTVVLLMLILSKV